MADLTYRVTADNHDRPIRYGHESNWDWSTRALADDLAMHIRDTRPDVTTPLTTHVWPSRADEHYTKPLPDNAECFQYPASPTR